MLLKEHPIAGQSYLLNRIEFASRPARSRQTKHNPRGPPTAGMTVYPTNYPTTKPTYLRIQTKCVGHCGYWQPKKCFPCVHKEVSGSALLHAHPRHVWSCLSIRK